MPINSKQKGNRAERSWAKWLRDNLKIKARRGQQFSGHPDAPDVVSDLVQLHFEVKHVERLNIFHAVEQAVEDAGEQQIPCVAHTKNHKPWLITIMACDLEPFCEYIVNREKVSDLPAS